MASECSEQGPLLSTDLLASDLGVGGRLTAGGVDISETRTCYSSTTTQTLTVVYDDVLSKLGRVEQVPDGTIKSWDCSGTLVALSFGLGPLPRLFPLRGAGLSFLASKNGIWNVFDTRDRLPRRDQVDDLSKGRWIWCRWICRRHRSSDGSSGPMRNGRSTIYRIPTWEGSNWRAVVLKPPSFICGEVDRHVILSEWYELFALESTAKSAKTLPCIVKAPCP